MPLLRLILSLLLLTGVSLGQGYGSVSGTVTDERGRPVPNVDVVAYWLEYPLPEIMPREKIGADGGYRFEKLRYGSYALSAGRPEDDYSDLYLGFFNGLKEQPVAALSETTPWVTVDLKLGKKAGILTGAVTDAETGIPIEAQVEFRCTPDTQRYQSSPLSSQFRRPIPSDTLVTMKVSKAGYEDWWFTQDGTVVPIGLRPGETLNIEVKLKKAP